MSESLTFGETLIIGLICAFVPVIGSLIGGTAICLWKIYRTLDRAVVLLEQVVERVDILEIRVDHHGHHLVRLGVHEPDPVLKPDRKPITP